MSNKFDEMGGVIELLASSNAMLNRSTWILSADLTKLGTAPVAEGGFGFVWKGEWAGLDVAIKVSKTSDGYRHISDSINVPESSLLSEANKCKLLNHANVVRMWGCGVFEETGQPFVVIEWMANGSLRSMLLDDDTSLLPWRTKLKAAADIARGMNYLHKQEMLHRDLKSDNVLVTDEDPPSFKVADFGTSRSIFQPTTSTTLTTTIDSNDSFGSSYVCVPPAHDSSIYTASLDPAEYGRSLTKAVGTLLWMAPEILGGLEYSTSADVYSYAIVLWEIMNQADPWEELNVLELREIRFKAKLLETLEAGGRPNWVADPQVEHADLKALMEDCWGEKDTRPSFSQIMRHSAFASFGRSRYHDDENSYFETRDGVGLSPRPISIASGKHAPGRRAYASLHNQTES